MPRLPAREERDVERGWMDPAPSVVPPCRKTGSEGREGAAEGNRPCRAFGIAASLPDPTAARQGKHRQPDPFAAAAGARCLSWRRSQPSRGAPSRAHSLVPRLFPGRMALVLGAVLLAAGAAVPPGLPAPRDLARSVLETHGQELRLLKLLGVARTVQRCTAQVSVFAFLPDVPLSMVECGQEPPDGSTQPRSPGTPRAFGASPGRPSSSSPPRPRPPAGASLLGTPRGPPSPAGLE
ncbi:uncharacterized protein LJ206_018278 isoform 2-T2 [Theristicus caerulescens]